MIELDQVTVGYNGQAVLRNISLSFPAGQVTVLLGPNGCGKSTLLKALFGLSQIQSGQIRIMGQDLASFHPEALAREVAYLPQTRRVPDMTAERLVLHGRFPYLSYPRRYSRLDRQIAAQAMEQVGILDIRDQELNTLSGGTRQKVYIAMALAQDTGAVLLDEPNTHLDIAHQLQLMELCRRLADQGKAVVLVLHDLDLAFRYADRIALFHQGQLLIAGDRETVCSSTHLTHAFGVEVAPYETPHGIRYTCRLPGKE